MIDTAIEQKYEDACEDIQTLRKIIADHKPFTQFNFDMSKAPRDGTLLQLLIEHDEQDHCAGGFDDAWPRTRSMGFNNLDHDGEDVWKFPGWDWCGDVITEQGCGKPVAWALMLPLPTGEG